MKVLVINGSPKGKYSVTLQYMLYLEKCFSKDEFSYLHIGRTINTYEKEDKILEFKEELKKADIVIFAYPIYTFLATAQLHRFIEILNENNISLEDKYVTQFTTSKHFYDVTAHKTVKACLLSLGGKYVDGLSSDMEDLTSNKGDSDLVPWFKYVKWQVENGVFESDKFVPISVPKYEKKILEDTKKSEDKKVLIVTDSKQNDSLSNMIDDFKSLMQFKVDVLNLNDISLKSGCLGCLKCTQTGSCAIKDGFEDLLNNTINKYDACVMAFTVTNHAMSSLFKMYYDRQFVNGHRTMTAGKPTAYIVSGSISNEPTLQEYMDAKASVGGNLNCGVFSDELSTQEDLKNIVNKLCYVLKNGIEAPKDFYEVGGMKIFRDMIYVMRGLMSEDYKFYKKNGMLDFPQKRKGTMVAMKFVGKLVNNKAVLKKMPNVLSDGMLMMYKKKIDKAKPIE